jgi:manganese transport system ATP-binding protein
MGISARGVSVSYGPVVALQDVDIDVPAGVVCGLVGVNGAGKSTLFKALLGLVRPDRGTASICGLSPDEARRRQLVAYVPQADATDPTFPIRVRDVVATGRFGRLRPPRRLRAVDQVAVTEALERVEMLEFADRQVGALSGGQRRRVFVARALAQDARVLLLDEPFGGIDVSTQELIIGCLREVAAEGRTILVSTHDLTSLDAMCDELLLLNRRSIAFGAVAEVLTEANLMETFRMVSDAPWMSVTGASA